jgi:hypothetical protein
MNTQAVRLVEITQQKANELFDEIKAELMRADDGAGSDVAGTDPTLGVAGGSGAWMLDERSPSGSWEEAGSSEGETYKWPDKNVDEYDEFVRYRGTGGFEGISLALGYLQNGDVVGFVLGAGGGSKRGITYFFPADDFAESGQKVSMIRGGGPRGRSGFGPGDPIPSGYSGFETATLRDRKAGKWNVLGVVVAEDDFEAMLRHTALQAKLRGLA